MPGKHPRYITVMIGGAHSQPCGELPTLDVIDIHNSHLGSSLAQQCCSSLPNAWGYLYRQDRPQVRGDGGQQKLKRCT